MADRVVKIQIGTLIRPVGYVSTASVGTRKRFEGWEFATPRKGGSYEGAN